MKTLVQFLTWFEYQERYMSEVPSPTPSEYVAWCNAHGFRPYLIGANLSGADLSGADLRGANLGGADLSGADLRGADLSGAYLRDANLSGANFSGANFSGAYLRDANLSGANFSGANLGDANLSGADLRDAKGIALIYALNMSTRGDYLYAVRHDNSAMIKAGCFWGTLDEFIERVNDSARDEQAKLDYIEDATHIAKRVMR